LAPVKEAQLVDKYAFQGLTSAQHRFVMLVFSGLSNVEAYRAVFDVTGWADTSVYTSAYDMANKPLIKAKLTELRQRVEAQSTLAPNLTREFILNGLMGLAINATKESVQLGALQTLGKTIGIDLFRDTVVTEKRVRTVEEVERELRTRLEDLKRTLTIEGESRPADSTPAAAPAARDRRRKPKA
jgi:hypothetical protein